MKQISLAPVRKTITVRTGIERAFEVFTREMGRWWLKSHTLNQSSPQKDVIMEPKPGGCWYELSTDGSACQWGHVIEWDPPKRVLLAWQINADWHFDSALVTEVEVRFTPEGENATRIDLEHRLFDRFGERAESVRQSLDSARGWAGLLEAYAQAM